MKKSIPLALLFISTILLFSSVAAVHGAGLKVKTADFGQWSSREIRTGTSPSDEEGWIRVTISTVTGHDLGLQLEDNKNYSTSFTQTNVADWYDENETYYFVTTDWDDHKGGWTNYFNAIAGASTNVKKVYFYFFKFIPRTAYKFEATYSSGSMSVHLEIIYDQTSGTLLGHTNETIDGTTRIRNELELTDSNVSQGVSFIAFVIILGGMALFVLLLSMFFRWLRGRGRKRKSKKKAERGRGAYYTPPPPTYSIRNGSERSIQSQREREGESYDQQLGRDYDDQSLPSFEKRDPDPAQRSRVCPFCGSKVDERERFCPKCGGVI